MVLHELWFIRGLGTRKNYSHQWAYQLQLRETVVKIKPKKSQVWADFFLQLNFFWSNQTLQIFEVHSHCQENVTVCNNKKKNFLCARWLLCLFTCLTNHELCKIWHTCSLPQHGMYLCSFIIMHLLQVVFMTAVINEGIQGTWHQNMFIKSPFCWWQSRPFQMVLRSFLLFAVLLLQPTRTTLGENNPE